MIALPQLIQVAPFSSETKKELLAQVDSVSVDKKLQLEELCWRLISQWYQNELRAKQEMAVMEMTKGEKTYTKEDFSKMGDDLFDEFVSKLSAQSTEEDLSEAREKLGQLLQDQVDK